MPNLGIRNASIMPLFRFSGWLKRFITKFLWHSSPVEFTEADICQNSTRSLYLKALFAFFNLVMEDFHSSNSFIYMCQGDQVREITLLYFVVQQLSTFHGSSSKGRRKPAHFPNMKSSTKFSQSQRNKFHCDPASMASFFSPLPSSLPLFWVPWVIIALAVAPMWLSTINKIKSISSFLSKIQRNDNSQRTHNLFQIVNII